MGNLITPGKGIVVVQLEAQSLLLKPVFSRDATQMIRSGMTFHHAIQGYAYAALYNKAPELFKRFQASTVEFKDGHYVVTFADNLDDLI